MSDPQTQAPTAHKPGDMITTAAGGVYRVADWYDANVTHLMPARDAAYRNVTGGRVYPVGDYSPEAEAHTAIAKITDNSGGEQTLFPLTGCDLFIPLVECGTQPVGDYIAPEDTAQGTTATKEAEPSPDAIWDAIKRTCKAGGSL